MGDTITITVEGEEAEDDEPLARTGFKTGQLVLIGLLIVAIDIGGVAAARRREDTREKV